MFKSSGRPDLVISVLSSSCKDVQSLYFLFLKESPLSYGLAKWFARVLMGGWSLEAVEDTNLSDTESLSGMAFSDLERKISQP